MRAKRVPDLCPVYWGGSGDASTPTSKVDYSRERCFRRRVDKTQRHCLEFWCCERRRARAAAIRIYRACEWAKRQDRG
jgi:hypothetical protein